MNVEEGAIDITFNVPELYSPDEYDTFEAKERASVLWLLAKAYDEVPPDLLEPFYRDYEQRRKLKPNIVHALANAELYSRALANIYNDPNFHNLDHHGIIQAITRKGICLKEPGDIRLTETILVQTAPLKMNAHMAVIDGLISLYIKEVLIPEQIVKVVKTFSHVDPASEIPSNPEEAAVLWINKCCITLQSNIANSSGTHEPKIPHIPVLQEIADISDGCCLAAVISFYCPNFLNWREITFNDTMSLSDSIYNLQLVKRFCCDNLPRYVDCLTLEDLLYIHSSIKDNVLVFIAELLFSFVIWPADCVQPLESQEYNHAPSDVSTHKARSSSIPSHKTRQVSGNTIPNLRADSYGGSTSSLPELRVGPGTQNDNPKESVEKPQRKTPDRIRMSPQLHRARSSGVVNGMKSSSTSSSSLTNSGDSDTRFSGKLIVPKLQTKDCQKSNDSSPQNDDNLRSRKSFTDIPEQVSDAGLRGYFRNLATSDGPLRSGSLSNIRENRVYETVGNVRTKGHDSISSQSSGIGLSDGDKTRTCFSQFKDPTTNAINIIYMQHDRDGRGRKPLKPNLLQRSKTEKHATFAALPNTTTWQKLALSSSSSQADSGHETPIDSVNPSLRVKLAVIRMQLDEKRREIELKKKRLEVKNKKQRQKLGKVAFMQAVGIAELDTPDSGTGKEIEEEAPPVPEKIYEISSPSLVRRMSMQEIADDLDSVQKKWLEKHKGPVIPHNDDTDDSLLNPQEVQASIEQLNSSLHAIQADISRISIEQEHVENLMQDSIDEASFYLHPKTPMLDSLVKMWGPSSLHSTPTQDISPKSQKIKKQLQFSRDDSYCPSQTEQTVNIEELYSKVVKPDHRIKTKVGYNLPEVSPSKTFMRQHSYDSMPPATTKESDVPAVPPKQSFKDTFYIPFNEQSKKSKTTWAKSQVNGSSNANEQSKQTKNEEGGSYGFIIGADLVNPDPETEVEMAKKKEQIMNLSIKRRASHETRRATKEQEYARLREEEQRKRELAEKRREEEKRRREIILEQYRLRKLQEEHLEEEGSQDHQSLTKVGISKTRSRAAGKTRPKSAYVNSSIDSSLMDGANKRNSQFITAFEKGIPEFDLDSLNSASTNSREKSPGHVHPRTYTTQTSNDGSLRPPEIGGSSDGASDTTSNSSNVAMTAEYTGPKLFVKPTSKSNRSIIINAMHTVLAGSVNAETKKKVLEEINKSDSKHFLILFRGAGCQFRALYSYNPDTGEVLKMFGIGPKSVSDKVMERFYKYNSGGKCFSEIQTKHLTVTIDAFTIPNSLWAGKKVVPQRKEFF